MAHGVIATIAPAFIRRAEAELAERDPAGWPGPRAGDWGIVWETETPWDDLARRLAEDPPVFVRHVSPIDAVVRLGGTWADMDVLADRIAGLGRLAAGDRFVVECRKRGRQEYGARDVEVQVGTRLHERTEADADLESPEIAVSVVIDGDHSWLGVSRIADNLSPRADEHRYYSRWTEHVSRAEFKLREALEKFHIEVGPTTRALDLGSAPGGWAMVLAERGAEVTAVDGADLDPRVADRPNVTHVRKPASEIEPRPRSFDLMTDDMNIDPRDSAREVVRLAEALEPGSHGVITLKLVVRRFEKSLEEAVAILRGAFEVPRLAHLYHNRQEVTAHVVRRGGAR